MTTQEKNRQKIAELVPEVQWAGKRFLDEAEQAGLQFRITEVFRTAEYQHDRWASHFVRGGPWRTDFDGYKKISLHQLRLAMDIYPINCTHLDIEQIALPLGITHPFRQDDPPHYQFDKVTRKIPSVNISNDPIKLTKEADMKRFARAIARISKPKEKERAIRIYAKRYGVDPYALFKHLG